jgi:hypothetical protein
MSGATSFGLIMQFFKFCQIEKPQSTLYEEINAWIALKKQCEGGCHHTCGQKVFIFLTRMLTNIIITISFPFELVYMVYPFTIVGWP